ncbi:hypothetical protein PR003_g34584, partial [Phytophthora rubi]
QEEASAARKARASRRQAARDEQEAPEAPAVGADGDRGLHDGREAEGAEGRTIQAPAREVRAGQQHVGAGESGDVELAQLSDDTAAVEMLRGRRRPRQPVPMPELLQVPTAGYIVERARRRVRNRAGRYELQHEAQYGVRPGGPSSRRWLSATEFEELLDAHKIEGDLGTGDGV